MTPKEIAYELLRGNQNASVSEIRIWAEVEAETNDPEVLREVTREYQRLRSERSRSCWVSVLDR